MLQDLRDKTQGWVTRSIFGLVCLAFILWGTHSFLSSSGVSSAHQIPRVNGIEITPSALEQSYQRLLQEQQMRLGPNFKLNEQMQHKLKELALQKLVASTALVQSAEAYHLSYTPAQVGHVIAGISAFQEQGHFSQKKFLEVLANLGFSETGFFSDVRDAMLINQLRMAIVGSSFALPNEIEQLLQLANEHRSVVYTIVPEKKFAPQATISEPEINAYYQENQKAFTMPETVTVQYLVLSLSDLAAKNSVSSEEAQKFYSENSSRYNQSGQLGFHAHEKEVRQAIAEQKALQNFSDRVDKLTNLTYTNPQSLLPAAQALGLTIQISAPLQVNSKATGLFAYAPLKEAAFSADVLAGNTSSVINVDDQHAVVIHLLKRQVAQIKPLDAVRNDIVAILKAKKMHYLAIAAAQALVSQTLAHQSLSKAAQAVGLNVSQENNIARFNSGENGIILNDAFQLPRPGQLPSVGLFQLSSGDVAVIQVVQTATAGRDEALQKVDHNVMRQKIEDAYAQLDYQLYVSGVLSHAKISME